MKPDIVYRPKPAAKAKPVTVMSRTHEKDTTVPTDLSGAGYKHLKLPVTAEGKKPKVKPKAKAKKPVAKAKRKAKAPEGFDRDAYQANYMKDRRAADLAGFGKGTNHKTVSQYREWLAVHK